MKKSIILSGAVIAAMLLCGCLPGNEVFFSRSFVVAYGGMQHITLDIAPNQTDKTYLEVRFTGRGRGGQYNDSGERLAVYNALCEKHNDVTYNRKVTIYQNVYWSSCSYDFTALEIWSSEAWDADHPALAPLDDIVRFEGSTPWPYIRSGYTQKYDERQWGEYYPIDKLVSELTPDDMTLLPSWGFRLTFITPPSLDRRHTLFVRLTADDGTEFETSLDIDFDAE